MSNFAGMFGQDVSDVNPIPTSFNGINGFYRVPSQWYCKVEPNGIIWATPNEDLTEPLYQVHLNYAGELCFVDMWRNRMLGNG